MIAGCAEDAVHVASSEDEVNEDIRIDLLRGLRVVELGCVARWPAAVMLADFGAPLEKYRLEPPDRATAGPARRDDGPTPFLSLLFDRLKTIVPVTDSSPEADQLSAPCRRADIVVRDLVANPLERRGGPR